MEHRLGPTTRDNSAQLSGHQRVFRRRPGAAELIQDIRVTASQPQSFLQFPGHVAHRRQPLPEPTPQLEQLRREESLLQATHQPADLQPGQLPDQIAGQHHRPAAGDRPARDAEQGVRRQLCDQAVALQPGQRLRIQSVDTGQPTCLPDDWTVAQFPRAIVLEATETWRLLTEQSRLAGPQDEHQKKTGQPHRARVRDAPAGVFPPQPEPSARAGPCAPARASARRERTRPARGAAERHDPGAHRP